MRSTYQYSKMPMTCFNFLYLGVGGQAPSVAGAWGVFGTLVPRRGSAPRTPRVCLLLVCCCLLASCRSSRSAVLDESARRSLAVATFDSLVFYAAAPIPAGSSVPPSLSPLPSLVSHARPQVADAVPPSSPAPLVPVAAVSRRRDISAECSGDSHVSAKQSREPAASSNSTRERVSFIFLVAIVVVLLMEAYRLRRRDPP